MCLDWMIGYVYRFFMIRFSLLPVGVILKISTYDFLEIVEETKMIGHIVISIITCPLS